MSEILSYIIKLSISLSVVYLFYLLVLRRLTFYNWNRWYLLMFTLLAFVWPLIDLSPLLQQHAWNNNPVVEMIPVVGGYTPEVIPDTAAIAANTWTIERVVLLLVTAGIVVMLVRLLLQYWSLYRIRRHAHLLVNDRVRIYQVNQPIIPFSFGNAIYLNQQLHSEEELKDIVRHEFIHVKQKHSADMIWGELLCILNWYNPFAWLTRHAIRQNLEFIADNQVLQTGIDRKQYQYLLLKVVGGSSFSIASNFNFSSLKKRIAMMNKTKSARVNLIRFLCMLPLVLVVLLGFRTMMPDAAPAQQAPATDTLPAKASKRTLPENVESITIRKDRATVTLKNGKVEKYNLDNEEESEAFENKYGQMPAPPAPLAAPVPDAYTTVPAPAKAPHAGVAATEAAPGVSPVPSPAAAPGVSATSARPGSPARVESTPRAGTAAVAPAMPVPPTPPPSYKMPKGVKSIYVTGNKATAILDNGKEETYDLSDPQEREAFEKKFGKPFTPPKPAAVITTATDETVASPARRADVSDVYVSASDVAVSTVSDNYVTAADVAVTSVTEVSAPAVADVVEVRTSSDVYTGAVLTFTPDLTVDQLDQLKKDFHKAGFTLRFDDVHHKDGKLVGIKGMISRGGKKATFDAKNFRKVVIVYKKGAGFQLNMLDNGHIAFNN